MGVCVTVFRRSFRIPHAVLTRPVPCDPDRSPTWPESEGPVAVVCSPLMRWDGRDAAGRLDMDQARTVMLVLGGVRSGKSRYAQTEAARFRRRDVRRHRAAIRRRDAAEDRRASARTPRGMEDRRGPEASRRGHPSRRHVGRSAPGRLPHDLLWRPAVSERGVSSGRSATSRVGRGRDCADARVRVLVSNEVGSGVVPAFKSGRLFRDLLGEMNQQIARVADRVVLLVAGVPIAIKGSLS